MYGIKNIGAGLLQEVGSSATHPLQVKLNDALVPLQNSKIAQQRMLTLSSTEFVYNFYE